MKTNVVVFIIFAAIYAAGLLAIVWRIRDIHANPLKYYEEELDIAAEQRENSVRHFPLFQSLSHQYMFAMIPLLLAFTAAAFGIIFAIHALICGNNGKLFFGTAFIGAIAAFFINIPLCLIVIPLHIKRIFFAVIATADYANRWEAWKRGCVMLLVVFAAGFPFYALACNNYGYYNAEGVGYSSYFQVSESFIRYEDIEEVHIGYRHNNSGRMYTLQYVLESDGRKLNVNRPNTDNKKVAESAYEIHTHLLNKSDCAFYIEPLTEEDKAYITAHFSAEEREKICYIFGENF